MKTTATVGVHFRGLVVVLTLTTTILFLYFCNTFSDAIFGVEKTYDTLSYPGMTHGINDSLNYLPNSADIVVFSDATEASPDALIDADSSDDDIADADEAIKGVDNLGDSADKTANKRQFKSKWKLNSPYIDTKLHLNISGEVKNKTILWWNPPGWLNNWFADFNMDQCEYKNCRVSFSQKHFHQSDAVVFSISDDGMDTKPPIPTHLRNTDQAWIFFTLESPVHVKFKQRPFMNQHWDNAFNWSWTYRTDADIFHPYGTLVTKEIIPKRNYSEIFRKKTKLAAWAVSHCSTYSEREKYEKVLNKYAKVDIFGGCGRRPPLNLKEFINDNYKFYLGFENSFCNEYMTEKFFNYYKMDIITIVRGKGEYNKYLPRGSFINTSDFPSIKALSKYIKELASNEEEYTSYLKIKDRYKVYERDFMYRDASCSICEKLNNLEQNRKTYKSASDWLGSCYAVNDLKESK